MDPTNNNESAKAALDQSAASKTIAQQAPSQQGTPPQGALQGNANPNPVAPAQASAPQAVLTQKAPAQTVPSQVASTTSDSAVGTPRQQATPSKVTPSSAPPKNPSLRDKLYSIHFDNVYAKATKFRKLGISEEVIQSVTAGVATELTTDLMEDIKVYGVNRARKVKVSDDRIVRQLKILAGLVDPSTAKKARRVVKKKNP